MARADAQIIFELVSALLTDVDIQPGNSIDAGEISRALVRDYAKGIPSLLIGRPDRLSTLIEAAMREVGQRDASKSHGFQSSTGRNGQETLTRFDIRPATIRVSQVRFAGSPSYY